MPDYERNSRVLLVVLLYDLYPPHTSQIRIRFKQRVNYVPDFKLYFQLIVDTEVNQ